MTLCLFSYRHGVLIGLRSLADLASIKPAGTASRRWNISSSRENLTTSPCPQTTLPNARFHPKVKTIAMIVVKERKTRVE